MFVREETPYASTLGRRGATSSDTWETDAWSRLSRETRSDATRRDSASATSLLVCLRSFIHSAAFLSLEYLGLDSATMEDDYFSIESILAENQKIQCTFKVDIPDMGHLDGGNERDVRRLGLLTCASPK